MKEPTETCLILVITHTPGAGNKGCIIDHGNPHDRRWLAAHAWWAMRSGVSLETMPITIAEDMGFDPSRFQRRKAK